MKEKITLGRIDCFGRIMLSENLKNQIGITLKDVFIEAVATEDGILLRKYDPERERQDWVRKTLAKLRADESMKFKSKIIFDNVTVLYGHDLTTDRVKVTHAICSRKDEFDKNVGIAIAYARMKGYEIPTYI